MMHVCKSLHCRSVSVWRRGTFRAPVAFSVPLPLFNNHNDASLECFLLKTVPLGLKMEKISSHPLDLLVRREVGCLRCISITQDLQVESEGTEGMLHEDHTMSQARPSSGQKEGRRYFAIW